MTNGFFDFGGMQLFLNPFDLRVALPEIEINESGLRFGDLEIDFGGNVYGINIFEVDLAGLNQYEPRSVFAFSISPHWVTIRVLFFNLLDKRL